MDDKWRLQTGRSGAHEWRTADPLGCARDDRKERTVARKGRLLEGSIEGIDGVTSVADFRG